MVPMCVRTGMYIIDMPSQIHPIARTTIQEARSSQDEATQREDGSGMIIEPTPRRKSRRLTGSERELHV